jgi:Zn-dependent peptidase ImmA (M78 family)
MVISRALRSLSDARLQRIEVEGGIPAARIADLKEGSPASASEVAAVARALHVNPAVLITDAADDALTGLLFRSLGDVAERDALALRRMSDAISAASELLADAPPLDKWLAVFRRGDTASGDEASQNAAIFRTLFADGDLLGPISSLPQICIQKLRLVLFTMDDLPFDGASAVYHHIPVVFLSRRFLPRMLFTLAHEVGHLVAHHYSPDVQPAFVSLDREVRTTPTRRRRAEQYAHAFSSELLLPRQGVGLFLKRLRERQSARVEGIGDLEILILSRYYNVSFSVAAMRCEQLELVPAGAAREFTAQMNARRGSAEKRADAAGLPAREALDFPKVSSFLIDIASSKIAAEELSVGRASALLGLPIPYLIDRNSGDSHSVSL